MKQHVFPKSILLLLLACALLACGTPAQTDAPVPTAAQTAAPVGETEIVAETVVSAQTAQPLPTLPPTPTPSPSPTPTPEPTPTPVPESFFDHTLFIGDSKTDGLRMWGRLGQAQYFCGTNYSVYNIFDKTASDEAFKSAKLSKVLSSRKYDQVYILLGYNECCYPY